MYSVSSFSNYLITVLQQYKVLIKNNCNDSFDRSMVTGKLPLIKIQRLGFVMYQGISHLRIYVKGGFSGLLPNALLPTSSAFLETFYKKNAEKLVFCSRDIFFSPSLPSHLFFYSRIADSALVFLKLLDPPLKVMCFSPFFQLYTQ